MATKDDIRQKERNKKMAVAQSPAGPIEKVNLKTRQQTIYWRPVKDEEGNVVDWIQTLLLPSDPVNRDGYLAKGFRLQRPSTGGDVTPDVAMLDQEKQALAAENARLREQLVQMKPKVTRTVRHRRKRAKAAGDTPTAPSLG